MSVPDPPPPLPIAYASAVALPFANRRPWLIVWGILFLLGAALAGCLTIATPFTLYAAARSQGGAGVPGYPDPGPRVQQIALAVVIYLALAVALAVAGVGSLLPRRWVRPLVLTGSAIGLIVGVLVLVMTAASVGAMNDLIAAQMAAAGGGVPPIPSGAIVAFSLAFSLVLFLLLPLAVFLSYRPQSVRETLEHFDPVPRWTDAAPPEVLGIALKFWLLAATSGLMALHPAVPVGPLVMTGASLFALAVISAVACAAIGWLIYGQRRLGWQLAMGLAVVVGLLMVWSGFAKDYDALWAASRLPPEQVEVMRRHLVPLRASTVTIGLLTVVGSVAYGMRVRHHFTR